MTTLENRLRRVMIDLHARSAELAEVQRIAKLGLWRWNLKTDEFIWSDEIYRLLGLDSAAFHATLDTVFGCIHPDDREETMAVLLATVSERQAQGHGYRAFAADGTQLHFWSSTQLIVDHSGDPVAVSGICQDITERVNARTILRETKEHYKYAVQLNPYISWIADAIGNILSGSARWTEMTGESEAEALGSGWLAAVHADDCNLILSAWKHSLETGGALDFEYRLRLRDGTYNWMRSRASPRRDDNGAIVNWYGILEDIQTEKSDKQALLQSETRLSAVLGSTTDSVILIDNQGRVNYLNPRALEVLSGIADLSTGVVLWDVFPDEIGSHLHQILLLAIAEKNPVDFEAYLQRLQIWIEVHAFPTADGLAIFFRNITEARKVREKITRLAHYDALTHLPNRAFFLKCMDEVMQNAVDTNGTVALIYLDLDDFKSVNDTFGHDAGDAVLVATAERLKHSLPTSALIGRLGGDEFAILIEKNATQPHLERLASVIEETLSAPVSYRETGLSSKASMGIALYPLNDNRPTELLKNADLALYKAKKLGGNQYAFFTPEVRAATYQRLSALSCARGALERDAIIPFYQPKVSLETGMVCGFEALLRWIDPHYGVSPPGLIKEAFEDPILSIEIGKRMLDQVVQDIVCWKRDGHEFGRIALNVASQELLRTPYATNLLAALQNAQLPTDVLEIEVTESVLLGDGSDDVGNNLRKLHAKGVAIALDDFGTGYASLSHLTKFPVSWLKIDQSFVREMIDDADAAAIVKAVVSLSRDLGIQVVAEGVETIEQWEQLKQWRCNLAQGYLVAKPMSAGRVPHFLRSWKVRDEQFSIKSRLAF